MFRRVVFAMAFAAGAWCAGASSQTVDHTRAVVHAQGAAYALGDASNGCPFVTQDMFGWPAALIRKCIYAEGGLDGVVYLLEVKPEVIARWIETVCDAQLAGVASCFHTVLGCGTGNSGLMFPIAGNMLENMENQPFKNYFFRNGMTVHIGDQDNGTHEEIAPARQDELALLPDSSISRIATGKTRYWTTIPSDFAAQYPAAGAPPGLATAADRQAWLDIAKREFLAALKSPDNRLLDAWAAAHHNAIGQKLCE